MDRNISFPTRFTSLICLLVYLFVFYCPQVSAASSMPPINTNTDLRINANAGGEETGVMAVKAASELAKAEVEIEVEPLAKQVLILTATAYTSLAALTDSTPWITASGTDTHFGVVATNLLPFGTRVKFPDHFGDQEFVVEDRMSQRFSRRVDIWLPSYLEAVQFGKRKIRMEVY